MATLLRLATTHRVSTVIRQPLWSSGRRLAHGHAAEYNNMPFDHSNSRWFAVKFVSYLGLGFALPFVAVGWQWYKPGGYKNPL